MAPKDYCLLALTGEACADPLSSFGVVDPRLRLYPRADCPRAGRGGAAAACLARPRRPDEFVRACPAPAGPWSRRRWTAGRACSAWARSGKAMLAISSGTSEVVGIVSRRRLPTPGVIAFPDCEGITLHAGPTQSGGASVAWLAGASGPQRRRDIRARGKQRSCTSRADLPATSCRVNGRRSGTSRRAPPLPASTRSMGAAEALARRPRGRRLFGAPADRGAGELVGRVRDAAAPRRRRRAFRRLVPDSGRRSWTGRSIGSRTSIPAWSAPPYWPVRLRASSPPSKKLAPAWSGPSGRSSRTEP